MSIRLSLLALVALGACSHADRTSSSRGLVHAIESPAGVGSGEPYLSTSEDAVALSWLEATPDGGTALRFARLTRTGWGTPLRVVAGQDLLVNWADFPSVIGRASDGALWAHWLVKRSGPGFAYDIRLASSRDGGSTWSEAWTPHEDGTATEHGFVSLFPDGKGIGLVWLDGRGYAEGPDGGVPHPGDDAPPPDRGRAVGRPARTSSWTGGPAIAARRTRRARRMAWWWSTATVAWKASATST